MGKAHSYYINAFLFNMMYAFSHLVLLFCYLFINERNTCIVIEISISGT